MRLVQFGQLLKRDAVGQDIQKRNDDISYVNYDFFLGVYLLSSPSGNLDYGTISRFTITAVDKGSPALTGTTYVDIIYKEATTTTTTTTAAPSTYNFWDDSGAVAAFSIAMVLGYYY